MNNESVLQGLRDVGARAFRSQAVERFVPKLPNQIISPQLVFMRDKYTPGGTGPDDRYMGMIPYAPDGDTVAVWALRRATLYLGTPSSGGAVAIQIDRIVPGSATGLNQLSPALIVPEGQTYASATGINTGRGEFRSGDRIQLHVLNLGTLAADWVAFAEFTLIGFDRPGGISLHPLH